VKNNGKVKIRETFEKCSVSISGMDVTYGNNQSTLRIFR